MVSVLFSVFVFVLPWLEVSTVLDVSWGHAQLQSDAVVGAPVVVAVVAVLVDAVEDDVPVVVAVVAVVAVLSAVVVALFSHPVRTAARAKQASVLLKNILFSFFVRMCFILKHFHKNL